MKYWLLKTEPDNYSVDDLAKEKNRTTFWDGVRNYQARNLLRDEFQVGDLALLYHSGDDPPGVVGICKITRSATPDPTAFDPKSKYYDDGKSSLASPRWFGVDVQLIRKFKSKIPLDELQGVKALAGMVLLTKGSRLSVQPVTPLQYETIVKMAGE